MCLICVKKTQNPVLFVEVARRQCLTPSGKPRLEVIDQLLFPVCQLDTAVDSAYIAAIGDLLEGVFFGRLVRANPVVHDSFSYRMRVKNLPYAFQV